MNKRMLTIALALCSQVGLAQDVLQEQLPQPAKAPLADCGIPPFLTGWRYTSEESGYKLRDTRMPVGKTLKVGDAIFYVALDDARKLYTSSGLIELKDRSPLNRDGQIQSGESLEVVGTIEKIGSGTVYEVVRATPGFLSTRFIPVKPDGMLCGDMIGQGIDGKLSRLGMPMFFQDAPLINSTVDIQGAKRRSASVVIQSMDAAVINLAISISIDGQVVKKSQRSIDLFSGQIALADLSLQVRKVGDGIVVDAVTEPTNYRTWMESFWRGRP